MFLYEDYEEEVLVNNLITTNTVEDISSTEDFQQSMQDPYATKLGVLA